MGELARATRGMRLPQLTRPASAGQIFSGYQAIDSVGGVVTGTLVPPKSTGPYAYLIKGYRAVYTPKNGFCNMRLWTSPDRTQYLQAGSSISVSNGTVTILAPQSQVGVTLTRDNYRMYVGQYLTGTWLSGKVYRVTGARLETDSDDNTNAYYDGELVTASIGIEGYGVSDTEVYKTPTTINGKIYAKITSVTTV